MAPRVTDRQILDAVATVVLTHGYTGATTRQIAGVAGINEATLFRRYGDKLALVRAAIAQEVEAFTDAGPAWTGDLEHDLVRVVEFYARIAHDRARLLIVLLAELPRFPELLGAVGQPLRVVNRVRAMVRRYQRSGQLRGDDPTATVLALLGPVVLGGIVEQTAPALTGRPASSKDTVAAFLRGHATTELGSGAGVEDR